MSTEKTAATTPCIKRCVLAACQALCTGCGRTRDEISAWAGLSEERRAEIMAMLPDRVRFLGIGALPPLTLPTA